MKILSMITCFLLTHVQANDLPQSRNFLSMMRRNIAQNSPQKMEHDVRDVFDKSADGVKTEINTRDVFDKSEDDSEHEVLDKAVNHDEENSNAGDQPTTGSDALLGVHQSRTKRSLLLILYQKLGSKELFRYLSHPDYDQQLSDYHHHRHRHGEQNRLRKEHHNKQQQKRTDKKKKNFKPSPLAPLFVG